MQKSKKYLSVLFVVISFVLIITGISLEATSITQKFSDVNEGDWFLSDVQYVYEKKLMTRTGEKTFSPDDSTTRGMIATVLWRMEGSPSGSHMPFSDVRSDAYYKEAIAWCCEKQIVFGYSNTAFGPDDFITREQLATMMYRYADYKGYDITKHESISKYSDAEDVSEYAIPNFEWAIAN